MHYSRFFAAGACLAAIMTCAAPTAYGASGAGSLIVWNGESKSVGFGWASPAPASIKPEKGVAHSGSTAVELQSGVNKGYVSFGWRWFPWGPNVTGTNVTGYKAITFWIKEAGAQKPADLIATVRSGQTSFSAQLPVKAFQQNYADGQWNLVRIPIGALAQHSRGFNPKAVQELDLGTSQKTGVTIYIDDIGFSK